MQLSLCVVCIFFTALLPGAVLNWRTRDCVFLSLRGGVLYICVQVSSENAHSSTLSVLNISYRRFGGGGGSNENSKRERDSEIEEEKIHTISQIKYA